MKEFFMSTLPLKVALCLGLIAFAFTASHPEWDCGEACVVAAAP